MKWEHAWNIARLLLLAAGVALAVLFGWVGVAVVALAVALHAVEQVTSRRAFEARLKALETTAEQHASVLRKQTALLEGIGAGNRKLGF